MNRFDSSSVESSMERRMKANRKSQTSDTKRRRNGGVSEEEEMMMEEGDPAMWETLDRSFRQVQNVLDRNRSLIQQVNENHLSRTADNMVKNVALIQEINGNISKVASMYSDLNTNFSSMFHNKNRSDDGEGSGASGGAARAR